LNQTIKSIINQEECERTELKNKTTVMKTKQNTKKKREFVVNKKEKHQSKVVYFLNRLPTLHLKILKKLHKKMFNNYQRIF
jgi:hypothetical protein